MPPSLPASRTESDVASERLGISESEHRAPRTAALILLGSYLKVVGVFYNLPKSAVFERLRIWEGNRKLLPPQPRAYGPHNIIRYRLAVSDSSASHAMLLENYYKVNRFCGSQNAHYH
jgi:hypothetical protein